VSFKNKIRTLIALNLALIAILAALPLLGPKTQVMSSPPTAASTDSMAAAPESRLSSYGSVTNESDWREWINGLRNAGVPTRALARVAREGFEDRWQVRQKDAHARYMANELNSDDLAAVAMEHDWEQEKAIRAALGDEDFRKWDSENVLESLNAGSLQLTDHEANTLYELTKKHRRRLDELNWSKVKGQIDQETLDREVATVQAEHDGQLKALLGGQRFAAMRGMDTDTVAGELKRGLRAVDPSIDVPFETLLETQARWNTSRHEVSAQLQHLKSEALNMEQALKRMEHLREQEFQRVLGTNVFDSPEKAQNASYQEMKRQAEAWGLDDSTVDYVYQMNRYYEKVVEDYERHANALQGQGQAVDWQQVHDKIREFAQQMDYTVRGRLGNEPFEKLKQNRVLSFAGQNKKPSAQ
jgi:hypothetical protein